MINKIKGFERGEIKKADISAGFSRLAPLIVELSKRFNRKYWRDIHEKLLQYFMMVEVV
jgi:hypothetical protein